MYVVNYTLDLPIGTSYEIVRMTISGDLRSGSTNLFYGWDVIAGKHIDKIERIK
jgi:hypothetical protein